MREFYLKLYLLYYLLFLYVIYRGIIYIDRLRQVLLMRTESHGTRDQRLPSWSSLMTTTSRDKNKSEQDRLSLHPLAHNEASPCIRLIYSKNISATLTYSASVCTKLHDQNYSLGTVILLSGKIIICFC